MEGNSGGSRFQKFARPDLNANTYCWNVVSIVSSNCSRLKKVLKTKCEAESRSEGCCCLQVLQWQMAVRRQSERDCIVC